MITVRASTVDSFALFMEPDLDFISPAEMEARLRGQSSESSPEAALGTAFHAAVAGDDEAGRRFDPESVMRAREGLDGAMPEVFGSVVLDVDGVPVRVTGHADWLRGLQAWDLKTSRKPIPVERHADAMQWRCYVLIFGVECFTYRHVQLDEDTDGVVYAVKLDDVVHYRYPGLRDDVVQCLRALLSFAHLRGCLGAMDFDPQQQSAP